MVWLIFFSLFFSSQLLYCCVTSYRNVSGVKCETTRNVTSYNFGTAASNGLSSGMSSGGGKMRRERGLHYLSRSVQEQVSDS